MNPKMNICAAALYLAAPAAVARLDNNDLAAYMPDVMALEGIKVLKNQCMMASLVNRDFEKGEIARYGQTVSTRKPGSFVRKQRDANGNIQVQAATATAVQVVLDHLEHVAYLLDRADVTKSVTSLRTSYIEPAMIALSQGVDEDLLALYADITASVGTFNTAPTSPALVNSANAQMKRNKVPIDGSWKLVCSVKLEEDLKNIEEFTAAKFAVTPAAAATVVSGELNQRYGFTFVLDQNVVTVDDTDTYNLAFHPNAFTLVTRELADVGAGLGVLASVQSMDNISMKTTISWDKDKQAPLYVYEMLYGVKTLDQNLAVVVKN